MKKARLILSASLLTIGAFSAITFSSCSKDDKICNLGYEGKDCDVEMRTKFIKLWSANDVVNGRPQVYSCNIAAGLNINQVIVSNSFSDNFFDNNINATVDGTRITIASQKPDGASSDYTVSGAGTYLNGQISWEYFILENSTGDQQTYSGTWK